MYCVSCTSGGISQLRGEQKHTQQWHDWGADTFISTQADLTQLEDVARSCCQGLGLLQDWHKLRVGCSSPCHKRPGAVSSLFLKYFIYFPPSLCRCNTRSVIICMSLTPQCLASLSSLQLVSSLSVSFFLSSPPPFVHLWCLSSPFSHSLSLSLPLFFSLCASPLSADRGGAIHANYGSRAGGSSQVVED